MTENEDKKEETAPVSTPVENHPHKSESKSKQKDFIQKSISWLKKDRLNLVLVAILIFAFAVRVHYFLLVGGEQPLWWDELAFGSIAKNYVMHLWNSTDLISKEIVIRPPLLPLVWAAFLLLKIPETYIRFILEIIPSTLTILFIYLAGKEIFNKKTGLIAAFIFSVSYIHLFYSLRLMTDIPSLTFLSASLYFFVASLNKEKINYPQYSLSLFLLTLGALTRYQNGIIFVLYFIILLLGKNLRLKDKKFWTYSFIGISPLLIFFILNIIIFHNIFPAFLSDIYVGGVENKSPVAWNLINFIPLFLKTALIYFFLIGIFFLIYEIGISYNFITSKKNLQYYLLTLLFFLFIFSFFIFYMRAAEDRWLMPALIPLALITAFGIYNIYFYIEKYNKYAALVFIIVILFLGAQAQFKHADGLIKQKKDSYLQMKQGFEWIKDNTPKDSVIIGNAIQPYTVYYGERQYLQLPQNESNVNEIYEADYLVIHTFVEQPNYIIQYLQYNEDKWKMIQAYFFDSDQKQPAFILFENINKTNFG
ncbi:hypothetical protein COU57_06025 [Candidatus Pacearchaeota archaeon CG10_big_fil_rev_8_21_14_0_10_32_14]|nr:MAG: hypothetical protein COU57_06025 [Candidatus Pacearchaeota archaeon CG10_big_fil_rev_8_21_14_0_10_32_14]